MAHKRYGKNVKCCLQTQLDNHAHRKKKSIPYRTKFHRTKFSTDKIIRRTKFSTPSRNVDSFVRFLPDFCSEMLDKIFDGKFFDRTKFSTPSRDFVNFVRRIFV